jgi:hypothetical protein
MWIIGAGGLTWTRLKSACAGRRSHSLLDLQPEKADAEVGLDQLRRVARKGDRAVFSGSCEMLALEFLRGGRSDRALAQVDDHRVGEASALSIDRSTIQSVLFQKQGEPAGALLPQWLTGYGFLSPCDRPYARAGGFRQDLFHRVYVFPLLLPPLRKRREDIPPLVQHFSHQVAQQNGWKPPSFTHEAIQELERYPWPENVRELRNVIERLLLAADNQVGAEAVRLALPRSGLAAAVEGSPAWFDALSTCPLAQRTDVFERETILAELKLHQNHITNAAKALGLECSHVYKKCQQLGIDLRALRRAI